MDRSTLPRFLADQFRLTRGIIAIDGGSAVGKTTLAKNLSTLLAATVIGTDSYLLPRSKRSRSPNDPMMRDMQSLARDVRTLLSGRPVWIGDYNHTTGTNDAPTEHRPSRTIIVEGVHAITAQLPFSIRIFFDATPEIMRAARRARDDRLGVTGYTTTEWSRHHEAHERYVLPKRAHANVIITLDRAGLVGTPPPFLSFEWEKHEDGVSTASGQPS